MGRMKTYQVSIEQCHDDGEDYTMDYSTISEQQYKDVVWICSTTAETYMSIDNQIDKSYQQGRADAIAMVLADFKEAISKSINCDSCPAYKCCSDGSCFENVKEFYRNKEQNHDD